MGSAVPGTPQGPDDVPAVEPGAEADLGNSATGPSEPDSLGAFRGAVTANLVDMGPGEIQAFGNEAGDAVQGAVVNETAKRVPAEVRPSAFAFAFDFDAYFLTYHDRLVATVRWYCAGDHALAEDVVQMTFLKAYECCDEIPAQDDQYAWLLTVARRVAVNVFRHEHLRSDREREGQQLIECPDEWEGHAWMIVLRQLPPPEDQVMWRRFVLRDSRRAIAEGLGMSLRSVDYHIRRALGRLRRDLSGED
jgi:RNA polymerase sigma factor (sigma-70 family)